MCLLGWGATVVLLLAVGLMGAVTGAGAVRSAGGGRTGLFVIHKPTAHVLATPSATKPHWVCPTSLCDAIVEPRPSKRGSHSVLPDGIVLEGSGEERGLDPADLRSAYKIPASGGSGQTVAVIEEGGYATAESDPRSTAAGMGFRRARNRPAASNRSTGKAKKPTIRQARIPKARPGWTSTWHLPPAPNAIDYCRGGTPLTLSELGAGVSEAAALGAGEVSVSYGEAELAVGKVQEQAQFNSHPGVVITASSGDEGYDDEDRNKASSPSWPANQEDVIAVGGTALKRAADSRGWSESVWSEPELELGTGSGCTAFAAEPSWQKTYLPPERQQCKGKMENDISAVAAVARPCPHTC